MANAVEKVNTIAIADIEAINTITDANLQALNTLEFTGAVDAYTLISTTTVSDVSEVVISSGIDSTYDVYIFEFINIHPETDQVFFQFQVNNATDGAGYNDSPITSSVFIAYHFESDAAKAVGYASTQDLANLGSFQRLTQEIGNNADQSASGTLTIYDPSSTTYVKHFQARFNAAGYNDYSEDHFAAGYIDDTKAIDDIKFMMSADNFDGTIRMFGLSKS
jgi:hypothetical protein